MIGVAFIAPTVFFLLGCLFLVWPVRKIKFLRYLLLVFSVIASYKTLFFLAIGGSVMAPNLPLEIQLYYGMLQNSYFAMIVLSVLGGTGLVLLRRICHKKIISIWLFTILVTLGGVYFGVQASLNAIAPPLTTTYDIYSPKFSKLPKNYKIAHLSDLHMGINITSQMIEHIVKTTNELTPDLIVITGDLVDGSPEKLKSQVALLRELKANDGVFIINGNHEYYSDANAWSTVWNDYGLRLLNNESVTLQRDSTPFLVVAGLADKQAIKTNLDAPNLAQAIHDIDADLPVVLLAHRPQEFPKYAKYIDLMLSGHTHGGMVIGLDKLVAFLNGGYVNGLYTCNESKLIVSRGTYLWGGFLARWGIPGEIGLITLHGSSNNAEANTLDSEQAKIQQSMSK